MLVSSYCRQWCDCEPERYVNQHGQGISCGIQSDLRGNNIPQQHQNKRTEEKSRYRRKNSEVTHDTLLVIQYFIGNGIYWNYLLLVLFGIYLVIVSCFLKFVWSLYLGYWILVFRLFLQYLFDFGSRPGYYFPDFNHFGIV